MSLLRVVYISRRCFAADAAARELTDILAASRLNNPRCGVTGALLVSPRGFAQVLEGPVAAVGDTFERIQCDPRHDDVTVLTLEPVAARQFGDWAMACCDGAEVLSRAGITLGELARAGAAAAQPTLDLLRRAMSEQDGRASLLGGLAGIHVT